MNDSQYTLYRTAEELRRRTQDEISARLAEVLGPCVAHVRDDTGFSEKNPIKYTVRVEPPWRTEGAWFQLIEGALSSGDFTAEVRSGMVLTAANIDKLKAGYEAIGAELTRFARDVQALAVDPHWIAEMARRDATAEEERKARKAEAAALNAKRAEYKTVRKGGERRIVGPGCDLKIEEHARYGYGRQYVANAEGLIKTGSKWFTGDTQKELLQAVQYHFVPSPSHA